MFDFAPIEKLMGKQGGLITRQQVLQAGIKTARLERALASGRLIAMLPGVYRRPTTQITTNLPLKAALLWAGPQAVLSHVSAGRLWKLEGLGEEDPQVTWLTVPVSVLLKPPPHIHIARSRKLVLGRDHGLVEKMRCTSLKRTLVDLSGCLDAEDFEMAHDSAHRKEPTLNHELRKFLKRVGARGRTGMSLLREIIERDEPATGSPLEVRVRRLLRESKITAPIPQLQICDRRNGEQIGVFDFAWPERKVVVLVDSWKHHSGRDPFEVDRIQLGALSANGWHPIPATSRRLDDDPKGLAADIQSALALETPN
jgi:hypothetical protein